MSSTDYDVLIVDGGPAGSTCRAWLSKHNTVLRVLITEPKQLLRDHVNENQLPQLQRILQDRGVWVKIEALFLASDLEKLARKISKFFTDRLRSQPPKSLVTDTIALLEPIAINYFVTRSLNKKYTVLCG